MEQRDSLGVQKEEQLDDREVPLISYPSTEMADASERSTIKFHKQG